VDLSILLAAFGLGVALGASPGPVQLLLFSEASRGGAGRGLRAMAGANATFGAMMLLLAAGLSSLEPGETFLRVVKVMYFDEPVDTRPIEARLDMRAVLSANGLAVLLLGLLPGGLMALCVRAIVQALAT